MSSGIVNHLRENFTEDHRVVFWHDPNGEYTSELPSIITELGDVRLEQVDHNEFGIKARILTNPQDRFLVYRSGDLPSDPDNWLLDLQLACGVWTADKVALTEQRFSFTSAALTEVITDHPAFFRSTRRTDALEALITVNDDATLIRAKMCQVLTRAPGHRLVDIIHVLLEEYAQGADQHAEQLTAFGLDSFLWAGASTIYHYDSSAPSVEDFVLWLFERAWESFDGPHGDQYRNIRSDFSLLRNDVTSRDTVGVLAEKAWRELGLETKAADRDYTDLVGITTFKDVDRQILGQVAEQVASRQISAREVTDLVQARRHSLWFADLEPAYRALEYSSQILAAIDALPTTIDSFDSGLRLYTDHVYRIDQLYRRFTKAYTDAKFPEGLNKLKEVVDQRYTSDYLYSFGQAWQRVLDDLTTWSSADLRQQSNFFDGEVSTSTTKTVVIISDALRYEIADELASRIRQQGRCDADLTAMLGSLPSYTQLGMASLLPHGELEIRVTDGLPVLSDSQPTDGSRNRGKILEPYDGVVLRADKVLTMSTKELRDIFSQHRVFYVYHDTIDAAGDSAKSEGSVFAAAARAITDLTTLVGKWISANASTILITADHGFLYQDCDLEPHFSLSSKPEAIGEVEYKRRFVVGYGLQESHAYMTFTPSQLGLAGDYQVQIPKSIHRIPKPGAGTRYVHGGATLPEIVVPVVTVRKKRVSDIRNVTVDIMPETDRITTNQLSVRLLQRDPVEDTLLPRTLRAGIYHGDELVSDSIELVFDSTDADQRARYRTITLYLNHEADSLNGVTVELRLDEPVTADHTRWRPYAHAQYTIKRSFVADFDF